MNTAVSFIIDAGDIVDSVKTMVSATKEIGKDPRAFLRKAYPDAPEHYIGYLYNKWRSSWVIMNVDDQMKALDQIPSLCLMLSRKTVADDVVNTILQTMEKEFGLVIGKKEQLICSWLSRVFKSSMYIVEMQELFPDDCRTQIDLLKSQGFEEWLSHLDVNGLQKCLDWATKMCKEKGHVGYDHELMMAYLPYHYN